MLVEIADRLSGIAGDDGVLVRLGGDEVALLVRSQPEIVEQLAHRVRIRWPGRPAFSASPGAASVGTASGVVASAAGRRTVLAAADLAMYDDKQARRGLRGTAPGAAAPPRAEVGGFRETELGSGRQGAGAAVEQLPEPGLVEDRHPELPALS